MPLFFPQNTKTKNHQNKASPAAQKPALQAMAEDQTKSQNSQTAAMEIIFPANKKHPREKPMHPVKQKRTFRSSGRFLNHVSNRVGPMV